MKTIKMTLIALTAVMSLAACKKDKVAEKTTAQKLQAKWSIVTIVEAEVPDGQTGNPHTYTGQAADYIEFKTDGKLYSLIDGIPGDVFPYTINNDSQITISGVVGTIKVLTDHSLVLYLKRAYTGGYVEATYNLKK